MGGIVVLKDLDNSDLTSKMEKIQVNTLIYMVGFQADEY